MADERSNQGFLGALGLGERSSLPLHLRFACRALGLFIRMRLHDAAHPSLILEPVVTLPTSKQTQSALNKFGALARSKEYAGVADLVFACTSYISDGGHPMGGFSGLVDMLARRLYPGVQPLLRLGSEA